MTTKKGDTPAIDTKAKIISARAVSVNSGSGYGSDRTQSAVEVTLQIPLGSPSAMPTWADFAKSDKWTAARNVDDRTPKAKAPKKGEQPTPPTLEAVTAADTARRVAIRDELAQMYQSHCKRIATKNHAAVTNAGGAALLMALIKTDVRLRISPTQGALFDALPSFDNLQLPASVAKRDANRWDTETDDDDEDDDNDN